jgi:carboxypeptidase T
MTLAIPNILWPVFASSTHRGWNGELRRARHDSLKARLSSPSPAEFSQALSDLALLDEPGALEVWRAALENSDPRLRRQAWRKYRDLQAGLARREMIPQVVRVAASSAELLRAARASGLDAVVWSDRGDEIIAAAPPYLIDEMRREGRAISVLYDSVSQWQSARSRGEREALEITPRYQERASGAQVRIAVIDLSTRTAPASGYSDWLGDHENIIMRRGSLIAHLDIFTSDGSAASIDSYIEERYARRGYRVEGFYTPDEFAAVAPGLFGKSFNAGGRAETTPGGFRAALSDGSYHSYEETQNEFRELARSNPSLARYVKIGTSYEGRDIFALKLTRNAELDDPTKPDVLITGCHHAREWISVEAPVYFANQLVRNYATDDAVRYFLDRLQIWIVPIVNPDGLTYSQSSPNDQMDGARLWRKNRRPVSSGDCSSSVGVDLNRNYDFQWRLRHDEPCQNPCTTGNDCTRDDVGASDDPENEIYRGSAPASEPEVRALKSLMDDPNRNFRAQIDYHNYSQLILYPWGYQQFGAPDATTLEMLASRMSEKIEAVAGRRYRPEQAVTLYSTTGSSSDYAYGVNNVAAPLVVEMRPDCCEFNVPESEIDSINRENWAGLQPVLNWAAGPPILESVKAYSIGPDGEFSKLVYSARWQGPADLSSSDRQMVVETRFPGIEPGPLQLHLQFSKTMNAALAPRATLGRDGRLDELRLVATGAGEGWQRTSYANDTWIGQTIITEDDNLTSPWQLAVSSNDHSGLELDATPETRADYATGTGRWGGYEDSSGEGTAGGTDTRHALAPTLRGNYPGVFLASPVGGERLAGGDEFTITWTVPKESGFIPAEGELYFSTDGGTSYARLVQGFHGGAEKYELQLPQLATARARIRLIVIDGTTRHALTGDSQADFTIGANVGSAARIDFVSSEKVVQNWSDSAFQGAQSSGSMRLVVNLRITNIGGEEIINPFLRVAEVNRGNILLTRDAKSTPANGANQSIDVGSDNRLSPGETVQARLVVGLVSKKKFNLLVNLYGVPASGDIAPAAAVRVWNSKPKNR